MSWRNIPVMALTLAIMLGASGCKLKKKPPSLPPQAQAPVMKPPSQPQPTQPGPPPPVTVEPSRPLPTPGEVASEAPPAAPPKPKHVAKKTVPPPKKPVAEAAPPPQPQQQPPANQGLTASIGQNDAARQTQQLLDETENLVRGLNRSLSDDEQAIVAHIRSYVQQSRTAMTDGDYERAHNLAIKAHLLADELVKK